MAKDGEMWHNHVRRRVQSVVRTWWNEHPAFPLSAWKQHGAKRCEDEGPSQGAVNPPLCGQWDQGNTKELEQADSGLYT